MTIDFEKLKIKAKSRGDWLGALVRGQIGYKKAINKSCFDCGYAVIPEFQGEKIPMCEIIGIQLKDPYCRIDEFHICNDFKYAAERKNIKDLIKGVSNGTQI